MKIPRRTRDQIEEAVTLVEKALGPVLDRKIIDFTRKVMTYLYVKGRLDAQCQQDTKITERPTSSLEPNDGSS